MRELFISNKERSEVNQGFSYMTVLHTTLQIYFTVKYLVLLKAGKGVYNAYFVFKFFFKKIKDFKQTKTQLK